MGQMSRVYICSSMHSDSFSCSPTKSCTKKTEAFSQTLGSHAVRNASRQTAHREII